LQRLIALVKRIGGNTATTLNRTRCPVSQLPALPGLKPQRVQRAAAPNQPKTAAERIFMAEQSAEI